MSSLTKAGEACELLPLCPFFNDRTYELAVADKERYCQKDYAWCGRYMAFKALQKELGKME